MAKRRRTGKPFKILGVPHVYRKWTSDELAIWKANMGHVKKQLGLAPGGPSGMGGGTVKVRAHIRKGRPVRESTRRLGVHAKTLLAAYRKDKTRRGVTIARRSMQMFIGGGPNLKPGVRSIGARERRDRARRSETSRQIFAPIRQVPTRRRRK